MAEGASFFYRGPFERELHWRGLDWIEGATLRPFYALAGRARVVVDVGANTGLYTLAACAATELSKVVAFEPVQANLDALVANLQENGWRSRCDVYDVALSNKRQSGLLHVPFDPYPVSASLSQAGFRGTDGHLVSVEIRTLDEELQPYERVDLVKIDVEGFEHLVLDGMSRTLSRFRPAIVLECNPDGRCNEITSILASHDYKFFHLIAGGPVEVPGVIPDKTERFRNFLCLPR